MKKYRRLAVFGGTFSPVHNGHVEAAMAYVSAVKPDVLYIIPTAVPPHKIRTDSVSNEDRLNMLTLAFSDTCFDCEVVISDIEFNREGKSYTIDTVNYLSEIADEIFIYCGTDMLLTIDKWYQYEALLKKVSVAYMQRENDHRYADALSKKANELSLRYGTNFVALPPVSMEVSSSQIREFVKNDCVIFKYVPPSVAEYILCKKLYK